MKDFTYTRTTGTEQNHGGMVGIQGRGAIAPGAKMQTLNKFAVLSLLSLSLALLGNCGGCGSSGGGGGSGSSGGTPSCTGSEILQNEQCEECTAPQFPNADRTACVANCPDGEYKPMKKPTCEAIASCTGREIHNPQDNSCFTLNCNEGEIADTTASPPACIAEEACRDATGKLLSVDGRSCISEDGCLAVANQLINASGECEACTGDAPVRNVDKTACISEATCLAESNQFVSANSSCVACAGNAPVVNVDKDACISTSACTDAAGHVATADGACLACSDETPVRSVDKDECITAEVCHEGNSSGPNSLLGSDCITDEACEAMENHVAQHDGVCAECVAPKILNVATGLCDADGDGDKVLDGSDNCPELANADQANADGDSQGDACDDDDDNDNVADAMDVDDDNDGLIEIATASELNNIRHDLAGASYKTGAAAAPQIAGAPESATDDCTTAVDYHVVTATGVASPASGTVPDGSTLVSAYLCGYELTADIDLAADDQDTGDLMTATSSPSRAPLPPSSTATGGP